MLVTDTEFSATVEKALAKLVKKPCVIDTADALGPGGKELGVTDYEALIADGDPEFRGSIPPTNGTRSRSTTPPAPPAIRRASSITIAART